MIFSSADKKATNSERNWQTTASSCWLVRLIHSEPSATQVSDYDKKTHFVWIQQHKAAQKLSKKSSIKMNFQ